MVTDDDVLHQPPCFSYGGCRQQLPGLGRVSFEGKKDGGFGGSPEAKDQALLAVSGSMTAPQLLHFVVRNVTYTLTATGYLVTCYTNYACHLWMRWTATVPQKHVNPIVVRGAPVGTFIDQCFVVFNDIEQNEPGDTFTHTFTADPWPYCQTRWFYFWGTVGGVLSPSASAIFSFHSTLPIRIYSDPGSGLTTVDGFAQRTGVAEPWAALHDGAGLSAWTNLLQMDIGEASASWPDTWQGLARAIMTFDLSVIPTGKTILSAKYVTRGYQKLDTFGLKPQIALYQSYPLADNNVVKADYQRLHTLRLSNIIGYDDFIIGGPNDFILNSAGLALLAPGQICRLGLREVKYDAPNIAPPWQNSKVMLFRVYDADHPTIAYRPYLEITLTG